ncbi:MAG: 50S ribosomal protein L11 methyltransferase [Ruminococcaceae bacterium]|nr:50S ribosomal protein L11 methyltransferase [Oscillospiraceae bacterium]
MEWTQIKITTTLDRLDTLCSVMSMLDSGLMIEDYSDVREGVNAMYGELIDEELLAKDPNEVSVSIFVPEEKSLSDYLAFLDERLAATGLSDAKRELIGNNEKDWENAWKQYYKPLRIGEHVVVVPKWESYEAEKGDIIVRMDPGMAFGTGTHETTRLCMEMLEKHMQRDNAVLDIGTGSGILAICAAKLGASRVDSFDIDPVSVRVAGENVADNGLSQVITCGQSDLLASVKPIAGGYDFVCANIVADILLRMSDKIRPYMKKGGLLSLSGIIERQLEEVREAYIKAGFVVFDEKKENDWCALVMKNA